MHLLRKADVGTECVICMLEITPEEAPNIGVGVSEQFSRDHLAQATVRLHLQKMNLDFGLHGAIIPRPISSCVRRRMDLTSSPHPATTASMTRAWRGRKSIPGDTAPA